MITLGGCSGDRAAEPIVATTDSLGITIVQSSRPAPEGAARFRVDGEPALTIGAVDGAEPVVFRQIRGLLRLSDGRIVVADGGSREVRYFSATGSHLMTAGGSGEGPGEFRSLSGLVRLPADSVWAYDGLALRFTVFDPEGRLAGTGSTGTAPTVFGRLADGSPVFSVYARAADAAASDGYVRPQMAVMRLVPGRQEPARIAEIAGTEEFRVTDAGRVFTFAPPFARRQSVAVHGDHLYTISANGQEIAVFGSSGELERLVRTTSEPRRITTADMTAYRNAVRAGYAEPSARSALHERVLSEAEYPSVMPLYRDLRLDADGYIWAELYRLPGETSPVWRVFNERGEWMRDVPTPSGVEIFEISADYLLGVWTDELGVEYVHLYDIAR
ncbi:MAG TPA: hypothetical protein VK929_14970 [Longimicrobiales bacterium]|nr:hypothetical protein [Longimicrobiales bacterium]